MVKTLKIHTKYHGEIEINKDEIIQFPQGIPSFNDEKQFYLLPFADDTPIFILQSVQTPSLAFALIIPFDFFPNYEVKLSDQVIEALQLDKPEDVAIFNILTIQDPFEKTTANLQGPIIINNKKKLGKQVILSDSPYKTKHQIFQQVTSPGKEG